MNELEKLDELIRKYCEKNNLPLPDFLDGKNKMGAEDGKDKKKPSSNEVS